MEIWPFIIFFRICPNRICFEQKYKNIEHPSMVKDLEKENQTLDEKNNRILACQKKEEEERRQRLQNLARMANVSS